MNKQPFYSNRSSDITELASALAKAQGEMQPAAKDAANPYFKSSYATLASIWDTIREPFSKNGLSVVQLPELDGSRVKLKTILQHTSGQFYSCIWPVNPTQDTPQGLGSAMTYARRYSLAAIAGVSVVDDESDDDGNAASQPKPQQQRQKAQPKPPAPKANGNGGSEPKMTLGQEKFWKMVQQNTKNYYKHPAHLLKVVQWPNFSSQDDIDAALSVAVDHANKQADPNAG